VTQNVPDATARPGTNDGSSAKVGTSTVVPRDEAAALACDDIARSELEEAGIDVTPVDDRLPEYEDVAWLLGELARRTQVRGKLDPHVGTALRLVADALGASTELSDAVQAAST